MDRNRYDTSRTRLLLIGASASVLALVALSGSCWVATTWADITSATGEDVGFWQILGVSSAGFVVVLLLTPMSRRIRERAKTSAATEEESESHDVAAAAASPCASPSRWREMYEQLSEEDQKLFRTMMKSVCSDAPTNDCENASMMNEAMPSEPSASEELTQVQSRRGEREARRDRSEITQSK